MANKKISELTEIGQLAAGNYLPVAIGNSTYKVDYQYFIDNFVTSTSYDAQIADLQNDVADLQTTDQGLQLQIDQINTNLSATYLAAYSNVSQQSTGNPQAMNLGTVDFSQNLSLVIGTKITIADTGIYNLQFSAQYENRHNGEHDINIWLMKNSAHVDNTNTLIEIPKANGGNYGQVVAAWNFLINATSGEQYELYWQCTSTNVWLINYAANGVIPATPSVITTVTKIN
jgi:hypothetical protein